MGPGSKSHRKQAVVVPRKMQNVTTTTRKPSSKKVSAAATKSAPATSAPAPAPSASSHPGPSTSSDALPTQLNPTLAGGARSRSPSPQVQNTATAENSRKRQRLEPNPTVAEDEASRKIKWRKVLDVMSHDVVTRKVSKEIDAYHEQARLVPRVIHPFTDPYTALMIGRASERPDAIAPDLGDSDSDSDEELDEEQLRAKEQKAVKAAQHCELMLQYNGLLNLIPDLATDIMLLDDDDIDILAAYIKYDAGKARTTDFNHITDRRFQYIAKTDYFDQPPTDIEKWKCGWEGFVTASLLCPPPLRHEFKKDWETFCDNVKNPKSGISIVADDWPLMLFDIDALQSSDRKHGPLTGFLRSYFFRLMFQSLWTGPISAKREGARAKATPGRPPLSTKYNIDSVSPRMLAYVAVLLRHSLTTAEWNISDLQFNNSDFFDKIVVLFEEPMIPWASETLEWWDREIFGNVPCDKQANAGRKTIAEEAREHHKAVRRAMKAGLDPSQVTSGTKAASSSPPSDPVASTSAQRRLSEEDAVDLRSQPVGMRSPSYAAESEDD